MIGVVLFALPLPDDARGGLVSGYVLTGLYLLGPLTALLRLLPVYAAAEIALRRIEEVGVRLHAADPEHDADPQVQPGFESLELREVTHRYDGPRGGFALGPISLRIAPAEIVFVTGGNGSGKSTLGKLLTGLYPPGAGERAGTAARWGRAARQLSPAVERGLLGAPRLRPPVRAVRRASSTRAPTRGSPSSGLTGNVQRRGRRALVARSLARPAQAAGAADRAARGPPDLLVRRVGGGPGRDFKQVFYRRLLPQLKQRGKAVIVIRHDDRYFGVADRLIELVEGRGEERPRDRTEAPLEA